MFFLVNSDCAGCAAIIVKSLRTIAGVRRVRVNYITDKVYVSYDPSKVAPGQIRQAIEMAGYRALEISQVRDAPGSPSVLRGPMPMSGKIVSRRRNGA